MGRSTAYMRLVVNTHPVPLSARTPVHAPLLILARLNLTILGVHTLQSRIHALASVWLLPLSPPPNARSCAVVFLRQEYTSRAKGLGLMSRSRAASSPGQGPPRTGAGQGQGQGQGPTRRRPGWLAPRGGGG